MELGLNTSLKYQASTENMPLYNYLFTMQGGKFMHPTKLQNHI